VAIFGQTWLTLVEVVQVDQEAIVMLISAQAQVVWVKIHGLIGLWRVVSEKAIRATSIG
jgi:hypothetical protein